LRSNDRIFKLEGNNNKDKKIYAPDLIHKNALKFIDDSKGHPFFLYYATIIPHVELIAPDDSIFRSLKGKFKETPWKGNDYGAPDFSPIGYCSQDFPNATFAAMVLRFDHYVGEIIEKLKKNGQLDNTVIIFTSDNGSCLCGGHDPAFFNSTAGLRGHKRDLFEGGIRAPMIVYWQGKVEPGTFNRHISCFQDVMPTFAEIAGAKVPRCDGISFLPTLTGKPEEQKTHDYLYWEFHEQGGKQAIRKGNWKAVRLNVSKDPDPPTMLFDLDKDPFENNDLAAQNPMLAAKMDSLMKVSRVPNKDFKFLPGEK
jgi:hypothetical protein